VSAAARLAGSRGTVLTACDGLEGIDGGVGRVTGGAGEVAGGFIGAGPETVGRTP